ncbi:hypothetical protein CAPTEDRAFT_153277 [Capitella teleta]|uniref:Signal transducing adapter molecule 1 n=1 Tax=Capitella teleta TaxID=283909 RepID=R7TU44_CAPTE|nr:hypothetical protein CAPTEDRAFT_153277 [Capitella teleta]|eukprot:ELT97423.1 hypothetical protein CAPTEDRAFT_153277 [Capitella teleta]
MPLFSSSTPFDQSVEKATNEKNTSENWGLIMDICDRVNNSSSAKDLLRSITKRLNHKVPHVAMQSVTLLDACVSNCGHTFHLEIASRDFVSEVRTLMTKAHPKVIQKMKEMLKKWSENEFKSDPSLDLIPHLYTSLKTEGVNFSTDEPPKSTANTHSTNPDAVSSQKEEDDIAKAIALSLQEEEKNKGKSGSLYPTFAASARNGANKPPDGRKVRALYDFEAAEDNELTFKAGEVISILDDSDPNWWKGSTWRGDGLFPANFVTADLTAEPEDPAKEKKSVQFNEEVQVKTVEQAVDVTEIDEEKIDKTLAMIQNTDPTGERMEDNPEMLLLEEQCKAMQPLIDSELEKIDKKHNNLMEINSKVVEALHMYHTLMRELPGYGYTKPYAPVFNGQQPQFMPPPSQAMSSGGLPPSYQASPANSTHGESNSPDYF